MKRLRSSWLVQNPVFRTGMRSSRIRLWLASSLHVFLGMPSLKTTCCIVGGGPAGIMLGYLLARSGIDVTILEKHADFFRDFRGDTIHPATSDILDELGLLEKFLQLPHDELRLARLNLEGRFVPLVDFSVLPTRCKFMTFVPQWDFLNFMSGQGRKFPGFKLLMEHEAIDLIKDNGKVVGVVVKTPNEQIEISADLVVATDGRHSVLREKAQLPLQTFGVPIDVLWMRIPMPPNAPENTLGYFSKGQFMVLLNRREYYQCGLLIPKDTFPRIQEAGLAAFHEKIVDCAPFLRDVVQDVDSWDKVRLLTVRIDRLEKWWLPGLLCIGDAAHAMSPAGGVGINLAIQDAVATANLLVQKIQQGSVSDADLASVQARREAPAASIQKMQVFVHYRIVNATGNNSGRVRLLLSILRLFPFLRKRMARFIGMGPLPEHVHTLEAFEERR